MKVERVIPNPTEGDGADARALADIAAGRVVPHDKVKRWLQTWGKPDETIAPPEWFKRK